MEILKATLTDVRREESQSCGEQLIRGMWKSSGALSQDWRISTSSRYTRESEANKPY